MISSSNVIRSASLADAPIVIGGETDDFVSAAMATRLEAARQEGFQAGYGVGRADAVSEVEQAAVLARAIVQGLVERARDEMRSSIAEQVPAVVDLAISIARMIVGEAATDAATGLADRLIEALGQIDDDTLRVKVHPDTIQTLAPLLPDHLEIEPDQSLQPGDAVAVGRWARADLTIDRAWQNIREAFDA